MEEEARSEATLRLVVNNFSKLRETALSPPTFLRNLPWQIKVMPRMRLIHGPDRQRATGLGFFLQCNGESDSSVRTWSCNAVADLKLISQKEGVETLSKKIQHLFYSKENDWGYCHFMSWAEVLDPEKGYIKDDTVIFEVSVTAAAPHGVRNQKRTKIECGICLDSLNEILDSNRNLGSTVCGHVFCNTCMEASRRSSNLCPACRKGLDKNQFHPLYF